METQDKIEDLISKLIRRVNSAPSEYKDNPVVRTAMERILVLTSNPSVESISKILIELGYALGYIQCLRDKEIS